MINNMIILAYHSISPNVYKDSFFPLSVTPKQFEDQLQYLLKKGYRCVDPNQIGRESDKKDKRFLITFDDGYADNYVYAYPIMKKLNCTGIIFMVYNKISYNNDKGVNDPEISSYLNEDQIRELLDNNIRFGSHTLNHPHLSELTIEEQENEIINSKLNLEKHFKIKVDHFCAPYGDFPMTSYTIAKEHYGYCHLTYSYKSIYKNNRDVLSRFGVYRQNTELVFKLKLQRDRLRII